MTNQHVRTANREAARTPSRWRWLLPVALVAVWLVAGGLGGSYTGRLAEVAENDNAAFLPATAESTEVLKLQSGFVDQEMIPAVLVWEADSRLTQSQIDAAAAQLQAVADVEGVMGELGPPISSEDGQAVTAIVPLDASLGEALTEVVAQIREVVVDTDGMAAHVTGPGGQLGDFIEAFAGIDGILLAVALAVVLVILIVVYRSPILPFLVLLTALFGLGVASLAVYSLADGDVITLNGQSQGILFILVVGAATDYALLLVARFREELREQHSRYAAMAVALRQSVEPIAASGTTVILGVLCLLFSDLNSNRGLGPVAAIGIAAALLAGLTFLPAVLVLLGRGAFWPFRPSYGSEHPETRGIWGRVARLVGRRPRPVWIAVTLALAACAAFLPLLKADGVSQTDLFLNEVESTRGQEALSRHFPGGSGAPTVVAAPANAVNDVVRVATQTDGVAAAVPVTDQPDGPPGQGEPLVVDDRVLVQVTLSDASDSDAAVTTVRDLRSNLDEIGDDVLVGGVTAQLLDTNEISARDRTVIIPIILAVIFLLLVVLLRALVAPLLLVTTVVLSFAAALGIAAIVFNGVFHWPGADPSVPLFAFVFLVALGIDYNIFLMTRVREESIKQGTRSGVLRGLAVTGGVITSAGLVLAATFSALAVIPILFLAQIAFLVGFGVLLDTFVVRSLLVPALAYDIGPKIWWPSRLERERR